MDPVTKERVDAIWKKLGLGEWSRGHRLRSARNQPSCLRARKGIV